MVLFSKRSLEAAALASMELPVTNTLGEATAAAPSSAAATSAAAATSTTAAATGTRTAGSSTSRAAAAGLSSSTAIAVLPDLPPETVPPPKQGKWFRSVSEPPPTASGPASASAPVKSSLSTTASGGHHEEDAFEAKYAHLTPAERRKIKELDALAHALDSKFGVGPFRIGYESIIGVIPFAGDAFGAAMGTWVISNALRMHLPKRLVAHMMVNVALDTAVGVIPFVGDIFDIAHKSNSKNIALLKAHMEHPRKAKAADTCFLCGTFFCIVVLPCMIFLGVLAGIILLILWLCKVIFH